MDNKVKENVHLKKNIDSLNKTRYTSKLKTFVMMIFLLSLIFVGLTNIMYFQKVEFTAENFLLLLPLNLIGLSYTIYMMLATFYNLAKYIL